jgi:hypothetical protein
VVVALLISSGLAVVSLAWIGTTAYLAHRELDAAKSQLTQLQTDLVSGDVGAARVEAASLTRHARRAHQLTTGPAWSLAAAVPFVGAPALATRQLSAAVAAIGTGVVPKLIDVSAAVGPGGFSFKNHKLDISALLTQTPTLDRARTAADQQQHAIADIALDSWLGPVNSGVRSATSKLSGLVAGLDGVDDAAHVLPTMVGYPTPQRYFVGFQNEAESRGSGGLPGAFAIMVADHGVLTFTHFGNDGELSGTRSDPDLGRDYNANWQFFDPTGNYLNSTVSPNFPDAARIWADMWQAKSGQHIDGAVSLDPTAASYLLAATGPATLPDGSQITSKNIVSRTESSVYAQYVSDNATRKAYLLQIAQAVDQHVFAGSGNSTALLTAAMKAVGQRRLLLWDANDTIQSTLAKSNVAGDIPTTNAPFVGAFVSNYASNKLDYYLYRSVVWTSSGCGPTRNVTATITLHNDAPASGLPTYVTQRSDAAPYPVKAGDSRTLLTYVGSTGGSLLQATVNGKTVGTLSGRVAGHPSYGAVLELPRQSTSVVVLHLLEPRAGGQPVVVKQPGVHDERVKTSTGSCD